MYALCGGGLVCPYMDYSTSWTLVVWALNSYVPLKYYDNSNVNIHVACVCVGGGER